MTEAVLTSMPQCIRSIHPRRSANARMRVASQGGRIEHISSMPGFRNSVTVNGSPGLAPISDAIRVHARRINLDLGDPDHVLVGHAQRQMARDLPQQTATRLRALVGICGSRASRSR